MKNYLVIDLFKEENKVGNKKAKIIHIEFINYAVRPQILDYRN